MHPILMIGAGILLISTLLMDDDEKSQSPEGSLLGTKPSPYRKPSVRPSLLKDDVVESTKEFRVMGDNTTLDIKSSDFPTITELMDKLRDSGLLPDSPELSYDEEDIEESFLQ